MSYIFAILQVVGGRLIEGSDYLETAVHMPECTYMYLHVFVFDLHRSRSWW